MKSYKFELYKIITSLISNYLRDKDGITVRYIDKSRESADVIVEPSLEDVYLYYFGNDT